MLTVRPGEHGSTYGGNPLACRVGMAALQVLVDERLAENAAAMGERLREGLRSMIGEDTAAAAGRGAGGGEGGVVKSVRGRGLLTAVVVNDSEDGSLASTLCEGLMRRGLLAKPTHGNIIRLAPPLCITAGQIDEALGIVEDTVRAVQSA